MRSLLTLVALVAAALTVTVSASGAGGKLRCFADAPATCTLNSSTSATLDTTAGGDAGVFLTSGKNTNGTALAGVDFSFTYFCADTTDLRSCIGGGAPRWSIPINTDTNSKTTEGYAFLDAQGCLDNGTQPSGGALTVSTAVSTCPVTFMGTGYSNWDAFAAAHPDYAISGSSATLDGFSAALPFVIADVQTGGAIIVSDVVAGK